VQGGVRRSLGSTYSGDRRHRVRQRLRKAWRAKLRNVGLASAAGPAVRAGSWARVEALAQESALTQTLSRIHV